MRFSSETQARSVVKAVTWRVVATMITVALVYAFTRHIEMSLGVGGAELAAKLLANYGHERAWNLTGWGRR